VAKKVTLYTSAYCPFCRRARDLLKQKQVSFKEVDLAQNPALRENLSQKTGWKTVPIIFIADEFVGGADDLVRLENRGELDRKLRD